MLGVQLRSTRAANSGARGVADRFASALSRKRFADVAKLFGEPRVDWLGQSVPAKEWTRRAVALHGGAALSAQCLGSFECSALQDLGFDGAPALDGAEVFIVNVKRDQQEATLGVHIRGDTIVRVFDPRPIKAFLATLEGSST